MRREEPNRAKLRRAPGMSPPRTDRILSAEDLEILDSLEPHSFFVIQRIDDD